MRPQDICRRLLVVLAVAFVVSAWLYCMATVHMLHRVEDPRTSESALITFFRDHGTKVLASELAALAVCAAVMVLLERRPPDGGRSRPHQKSDVSGPPKDEPDGSSTQAPKN